MSNPERINIKDLTTEEPSKKEGLPFDPEKEITEKDWNVIRRNLGLMFRGRKESHTSFDWPLFFSHIAAAKLLFPEKVNELGIDEHALEEMKQDLEGHPGTIASFLVMDANIKIFFPGGKGIETEDFFSDAKKTLQRYRSQENWPYFAYYAMYTAILFPNKISELNIDETAWQGMIDSLGHFRNMEWVDLFARLASEMRLLCPERTSELGLDAAMWQKIKELFDLYRSEDKWIGILDLAKSSKLLAAEEIKITDQGLEIIMQREKPEFKEETPPIPQTRKF